MLKWLVISLFLLLVGAARAQSINVYGQVVDSLDKGVPGVSTMLIGANDSILKSFSVTNDHGSFTFKNVPVGDYIFKAALFGYQPYETSISISTSSADTALKVPIQSKQLKQVTVEGYVPIQLKGDTIEYDARAFETTEHDNVEALLEQMPGIEVEEDGEIKVQGETVEKVLVDGEEFFGNDPKIATQNLPAKAIEKVQVFDKLSDVAEFTGIDDGDDTKTINLKLKEEYKKGAFGNLDLAGGMDDNAGRYKLKGNVNSFGKKFQFSALGLSNNINETGFSIDDYIEFMGGIQSLLDGSGNFNLSSDAGLPLDFGRNNGFLNTHATGMNFNYKPNKGKNLNGSLFLNGYDRNYHKLVDRTTYFTDSAMYTNEENQLNNKALNNRLNLRYKNEIDSSQLLNVRGSGRWSRASHSSQSFINNQNEIQELISSFVSQNEGDNTTIGLEGSLDYTKRFKRNGHYTGIDLSGNYSEKEASSIQDFNNSVYVAGVPIETIINQLQRNQTSNLDYQASGKYSIPFLKDQYWLFAGSAQFKSEFRDKSLFDINASQEELNPNFSGTGTLNTYNYEGGATYKYVKKDWRTSVGANYSRLSLFGDGVLAEKKDMNYLLPRVSWWYQPSRAAEIDLVYSTSVNAPLLNELQTIPNNTNPTELILGNENLTPEYVHDVSLRFNRFKQFNMSHFMVAVSGKYIQNNITFSQWLNESLVRTVMPENLGDEQEVNGQITWGRALYPLKTKFKITNQNRWSSAAIRLNDEMDQYTSFYNRSKLVLENISKKKWNIRVGGEVTYSKNQYQGNEAFNNSFYNWNYSCGVTWKQNKNWIVESTIKHQFYPTFTEATELLIWNARIGRNLLESKKMQVYLTVKDILNQNTGLDQFYQLNYYERAQTSTLGRYFLVGLKWSFVNMKEKK